MTTFSDLGVPRHVVDALARGGISTPFPIQTLTVADALAGRDLSGRAPTGSGKTLAFAIPLAVRATVAQPKRPTALVLVPTRELAAQVAEELQPLAEACGLRVATFYGGTSLPRDMRCLRDRVDIAVACPGRLDDLLQRRAVDLSDVGLVVVDEADRMADMGFLPVVRRLLDRTRADRQTLLFSATLDGDVDALVRGYQRDPVRRELPHADAPKGDVRHVFWRTPPTERVRVAAQLIGRHAPAIVFTRTKHGADRVAKQLVRAGVSAAAIHGDRSQGQRERALADFHGGRVSTLVATDVAARGIHVDDVAVVVHFDAPTTDKDYVHRSGRTGRAGADGLVVTFVVPDKAADVAVLQRQLSLPITSTTVDVAGLAAGGARLGDAPPPERHAPPATLGSRPQQRTRARRGHTGGDNAQASARATGAQPSRSRSQRLRSTPPA